MNHLTNKTFEKLKYDLVREGLISFEELSKSEENARIEGKSLALFLTEQNLIAEDILLGFIETKLHIPFVNLEDYSLDKNCIKFISQAEAEKYQIIPLFKIENVLTVAMADPLNLFILNGLISSLSIDIEPIICSEKSILKAINECYEREKAVNELEDDAEAADWRLELSSEASQEIKAEKILFSLIRQAVRENFNEIILQPDNENLSVRFRKGEIIEEKGEIPFLLNRLIINNIKNSAGIESDADFGSGRISAFEGFSLLVYILPTISGQCINIKIYKKPQNFNKLGINPLKKEFIQTSLEKRGIISVTAESLIDAELFVYSVLFYLAEAAKNTLSIESKAKFIVKGINQCEINEKIGFNLKKAVETADFYSPDILYAEDSSNGQIIRFLTDFVLKNKTVIIANEAESGNEFAVKLENQYGQDLIKNITCYIHIDRNNELQILENSIQV